MDLNENIVENNLSHTKKTRKRHLNSGPSFNHTGPYTMDDWKAGNQASKSVEGGKRGVTNVDGANVGVHHTRPRRLDTAFSLFLKKRELELTDTQKRKLAGGINGSLLAEWKLMTPQDKAPFEAREAELKAAKFPIQNLGVHPARSSLSQRDACHKMPTEPNLPSDLVAITPTMHIEEDFPWNEVFKSLNIKPFTF